MLKFFRTIRKNLIEHPSKGRTGGNVRKYLLYAIGEVFLVVIGILIALQVNNWNENRKTDHKINNSLRALKDDLVKDTLLIVENLPEVNKQYQLNEQIRAHIAKPQATLDTLIKVARFEFNPNWTNPIFYNTNAYNSLNETGLIENLKDSLKAHIKNYYNGKFYRIGNVTNITMDYRKKVSEYVKTYTFGSTSLHDQGPLIDALVWNEIEPGHLAATFQGISNFKRLLFRITKSEMEYSINNSRLLIQHIDDFLEKRGQDGF